VPTGTKGEILGGELTALLNQSPAYDPKIFSEAIKVIGSIESKSSCFRLAASSLLTSCKSLEKLSSDPIKDSEARTESLNEQYAARLALCELDGARVGIPRTCNALRATEAACPRKGATGWFFKTEQAENKQTRLCYSRTTHAQFLACLSDLHKLPQSWTSYSNARQNAHVICHASRLAVEKEAQLKVFQTLVRVTSQLNSGLMESLQDAYEFSVMMKKLQTGVVEDINESLADIRAAFETLVNRIDSATTSFNHKLSTSVDQAEIRVYQVANSINRVDRKASSVYSNLQHLHSEIARQQSEYSAIQQGDLQAVNTLATGIKLTLEHLHNSTVPNMSTDINALHSQIGSLITSLQSDQSEFQKISAAYTEELGKKTAELQRIAAFRGIIGFMWNWAGIGIAMSIGSFCFVGFLSLISMKLAMCCAIVAGKAYSLPNCHIV